MAVTRDDIQDPSGQRSKIPGRGFTRGYGIGTAYQDTTKTIGGIAGNPINGEVGWAPGALFINVQTAIVGSMLWENLGSQTNASWRNLDTGVGGVANGYKIARGVSSVTGTLTVVTGLTTVVAVTATPQTDPDGVTLAMVSATIGDQAGTPAAGSVILKTWKVTATGDATLIAATAAKSVNWVAIGT